MSTELLEVLGATGGLVACVGAGGKKSTLYRLAAAHPGRVGLTATAHIERFPRAFADTNVVADAPDLVPRVCALATRSRVVAFARPCELPGRHLGVHFDELAEIRARAAFDLCLVKADGARNRIVKAPAEHEPALPPDTTTVIPVCSIRAVGQPLDATLCHRPDRFAAISGCVPGSPVEITHLAALLAHPEGSLRHVGAARVIPLVNMVDDPALERLAVAVAEEALARTTRYDCVVLAAMRSPDPIVRVVRR
ncbi:MAG: selenium cofactor biosynthesis protein YqeC [Gammaproteobacteria bacterium]